MEHNCNGPREHYIDLACPFGKTNSTLEFCPPVALFAKSVVARYSSQTIPRNPKLDSYVDDIFGGLRHDPSYEQACKFRRYICETGKSLTLSFNMELHKTPLPAKRQVILGCLYDSVSQKVRTAEKKRKKYIKRITDLLKTSTTTVTTLQKLHGNLNYAAEVTPFGRPFLAPLTNAIAMADQEGHIPITEAMRAGLQIWLEILHRNRGSSYTFVLGKLPRGSHDIFVDASTEWGIGG